MCPLNNHERVLCHQNMRSGPNLNSSGRLLLKCKIVIGGCLHGRVLLGRDVALYKGMQDDFEFWIPTSAFWIHISWFQIPTKFETHLLVDSKFLLMDSGLIPVDFRSLLGNSAFILVDSRFLRVDSGLILVDSGFILVDSRFLLVDSGFLLVDSRFPLVESGFLLVESRFLRGDSGFILIESRCLQVDSRFLLLDSRFLLVDSVFLINWFN